ncbi:peptidase M23 [Streptomyces spinoverrucosus]|uniref:Peptidase M23 n=1 Tax=Streptomyces spinoverrucosus TaxID=284043 RepID=A0A4Y3VTL7_9ACTN|nr:LysM peptidoglycan-binding domain-containing protein [Streptomyces spinoverrucosus]GEC09578.1 peptidase M23 [Streptomyces spinoverrucosus]GHB96066.1 peptidase M23 [Streptomyces spinoverrucosus]
MVNAMLICSAPPMPGAVPFAFNPEKVTMARDSKMSIFGSGSLGGGKPAGSTGTTFKRAEPAKITLSEVTFTGMQTKPLCDQLLNWLSPGSGALGQAVGGALAVATKGAVNLTNNLPTLTFQWGVPEMGFWYQVVLSNVSISYVRFNRQGIPVRAKVTMTMIEQPSLLGTLPTNPTSGGLPGRSSHTVTEGEDLPALARTSYGSPSAWRTLAEANDIDDPLRVRPGQTLYLPNSDELAGR